MVKSVVDEIEFAIKKVWPYQAPKISRERVENAIKKSRLKLEKNGCTIALHGSYTHFAMEVLSKEHNKNVNHCLKTDIVKLEV